MKIMIPMLSFGRTGGQRVLSNLASSWINMGHQVTMLVHYSSEPIYFPTTAQITWFDNQGQEVKRGENSQWKEVRNDKNYFLPLLLYGLWKAINRHGKDYDIIVANQSISTPIPVYLSKTIAKKFYYVQLYEPSSFVDLEDPNLFVNKKPAYDSRMWLISSVSYLLNLNKIVNSPIYLNYKLLKSKYCVPPGIDLSVFYPKENYLDRSIWRNKTVRIGCISRIEPWKGTQYVIEAYNLLRIENWDVELFLAYGDIPDGCNLPTDAKVLIPKNDLELADFYRSLDIMIAPGTIQLGAAHYPVMEAMACGTPVITTGYMPATTENDNAWIVPIRDAQAIANSVREIIIESDPRCRKLSNALKDIQEFSWESVSAKMIDIFKYYIIK